MIVALLKAAAFPATGIAVAAVYGGLRSLVLWIEAIDDDVLDDLNDWLEKML